MPQDQEIAKRVYNMVAWGAVALFGVVGFALYVWVNGGVGLLAVVVALFQRDAQTRARNAPSSSPRQSAAPGRPRSPRWTTANGLRLVNEQKPASDAPG